MPQERKGTSILLRPSQRDTNFGSELRYVVPIALRTGMNDAQDLELREDACGNNCTLGSLQGQKHTRVFEMQKMCKRAINHIVIWANISHACHERGSMP